MKVRLLTIAFAGLLAGACAPAPTTESPRVAVSIETIRVAPADYGWAAWPADDRIITSWRPESADVSAPIRLVALRRDSTRHEPLPFQAESRDCWAIEESSPVSIGDGRVAFVRVCRPREAYDVDLSVEQHDVITADAGLGNQSPVARLGEVAVADGKRNVYSISVGPDGASGAVTIGTVICDAVASFDAQGIHPLDIDVGDGANLADPFAEDCEDTANAREAIISPDGALLALFTSSAAKGIGGMGRLDAPWDLLVVRRSDSSVVRLADGLSDPQSLAWSPDGRWLVLGTDSVERGPATALVAADGSSPPQFLDVEPRLTSFAWSPDGRSIFAFADQAGPDDALLQAPVILDVSGLVR